MAQMSELEEQLSYVPGIINDEIVLICSKFPNFQRLKSFLENGNAQTEARGYHPGLHLTIFNIAALPALNIYYWLLDGEYRINERLGLADKQLCQDSREHPVDLSKFSESLWFYDSITYTNFVLEEEEEARKTQRKQDKEYDAMLSQDHPSDIEDMSEVIASCKENKNKKE